MANTHDLFQRYLDEIRLDPETRTDLKTSRDANRDRISRYFTDTLKRPAPLFKAQGSYPMHTGVNPTDGNCDIDDGVYIQGLGTDQSKWPTPETVHGWLVAATKGYTSKPPQDKARCVRVQYAGGYHIDLPSYAEDVYGSPLIFEKNKPPYESNAAALTEWFNEHGVTTPQIRRLVRYLKAWKDFQSAISSTASGLALTILVVNHHRHDERDDVALVRTAAAIHQFLLMGGRVTKPVTPYDDLSSRWSSAQRTQLIEKMENLKDRGQDALDEPKRDRAANIWRKLLGDRFPEAEPEKNEGNGARRTSSPAILGSDGRSA